MLEAKYNISPQGTEAAEACAGVERFLRRQGLCAREAARLRLTVDMLLRRFGERYGRAVRCELELGTRLGRAYIRLSCPGSEFDPTLTGREEEGNAWSERVLRELGLIPQWSRERGINSLTLCPRRRTYGAWMGYAAALILAAVAYFTFSGGAGAAVGEALLASVYETVCSIWGTVTAPLVFLGIISAVCGMADTAQLGRQGTTMMARFLLPTLLCPAAGAAVSLLLPHGNASAQTAEAVSDAAARPGAAVIMLAALAVGAALALLGGRTARLREIAEQLAVLVRTLSEYACRLAPIVVFAALAGLLRRDAAGLWLPLAVFAAVALAAASLTLLSACLVRRVSPPALLKPLREAASEALKCMSTDGVIGLTMDACENDLGISHTLTLLGLPVGNVLCVPFTALALSLTVCFTAHRAGILMGVSQLALLALACAALAVVLPHCPGALPLGAALLLKSFALPPEGIAATAVLGIAIEPISAAIGTIHLCIELVLQSFAEKRILQNNPRQHRT